MKKLLFVLLLASISFQTYSQTQKTTVNDCPPVPWVSVEEIGNDRDLIQWDKPCDTCNNTLYFVLSILYSPCEGYAVDDTNAYVLISYIGTSRNLYYESDSHITGKMAGVYYKYDSCFSQITFSNYLYGDSTWYNSTFELQTIINDENENVLPNAFVKVYGKDCFLMDSLYTSITNASGESFFEEIMNGTYTITVSKQGYQTIQLIDYRNWRDSTLSLTLEFGPDPKPENLFVDEKTGDANWSMPALKVEKAAPMAFNVYLNNEFQATIPDSIFQFTFDSLQHGIDYTASVCALYDWGESFPETYQFTTDFAFVNNYIIDSRIFIFPNPATNQLTVESAQTIEKIFFVNHFGQTILEKSIDAKQAKVNTSELKNGIYFLRVKTDKGILNKKVVIQH
jgi:hypothetical protein